MTFWEAFFRLLPRRPIQALGALYWHLTRRRVRARNQIRRGAALLPNAHYIWTRTHEPRPDIAAGIAALAAAGPLPRFEIAMVALQWTRAAERTARSLVEQRYPGWRLTIVTGREGQIGPGLENHPNVRLVPSQGAGSAEALILAAEAGDGDFLVPIHPGDQLAPAALLRFAQAARAHDDAAILYGDEDSLSPRGKRHSPWFKPDWNEELLLAFDYMSGACALRSEQVRRAIAERDIASLADLLLAIAAKSEAIVHIPHILVHRGSAGAGTAGKEWRDAVAAHVSARGASCAEGPFGTVKVVWPLPESTPLVTIIIPTRDKVSLLKPCVESLLAKTSYPAFELIIVDNDSSEPAALAFLDEAAADPRVRVMRDHRPYNFSAINNRAAAQARGSFLCFLNNDTEVIGGDWLTELMRYAVRPDIGAAGAQLLYSNGTIQHAGVVVGMGEAAGHAHRFARSDQPGYFRLPHAAHYVSAVTAACLVVAKAKFEEVGGFDEKQLAVAYNDVDLCLKLLEAGYRNVYVPHARLFHHESMSRGDDKSKQHIHRYSKELEVLQKRWGTKTFRDPMLNPNLDRYSETYIAAMD